MRKRTILAVLLVILSVTGPMNAFAEENAGKPNTFLPDMFNSIGSFIYNALPWNWGGWAGPIGDLPADREGRLSR